jgi:hypothetical protein
MPRNVHMAATPCLLAAACSLCVLATSSVVAKQKSVAPTTKQKSITPTDQTPANKNDCIALSEALYRHLSTLMRKIIGGRSKELNRAAKDFGTCSNWRSPQVFASSDPVIADRARLKGNRADCSAGSKRFALVSRNLQHIRTDSLVALSVATGKSTPSDHDNRRSATDVRGSS